MPMIFHPPNVAEAARILTCFVRGRFCLVRRVEKGPYEKEQSLGSKETKMAVQVAAPLHYMREKW